MLLGTSTAELYQKNYEKRYVLCISVPSDGRSWNYSSEICSQVLVLCGSRERRGRYWHTIIY